MPHLVALEPGAGRRHRVLYRGATLGRSDDCDIQLDDHGISRHHARITFTLDGWRIEDLCSTNGVYVNERAMTRSVLRDGDLVRLGHASFRFVDDVRRPN